MSPIQARTPTTPLRQGSPGDLNPVAGVPARRATIVELIHERAAITPAAIAVIEPLTTIHPRPRAGGLHRGADTRFPYAECHVSYEELSRRSVLLAGYLKDQGVGPGAVVAICAARSSDLLVAMLGVLTAGAAYLPLDPTRGPARLSTQITAAGARVVLTQRDLPPLLAEDILVVPLDTLDLGRTSAAAGPQRTPHLQRRPQLPRTPQLHQAPRLQPTPQLQQAPQAPLTPRPECGAPNAEVDADRSPPTWNNAAALSLPSPEALAYVGYPCHDAEVSGAVEIDHSAVANLLSALATELGGGPEDAWLALAPPSCGTALPELLLPLLLGATIVMPGDHAAADPASLLALIEYHQVTHLSAAPALWRSLLAAGLDQPGMAAIVCRGRVGRRLAGAVRERVRRMSTMYGSLETTIWSVTYPVTDPPERMALGRPMANTCAYLLDRHLEPVPIGQVGELYLGGAGLARGYRGQPALTKARFIAHWLAGGRGRLFRTGDRARWNACRQLEYLGPVRS